MSKERFDWLKSIAGQIIATPGCESNVKEIFDKTWELKQDPTMMIFNQFAEMGNPLWHYNVTGYALADLFEAVKKPGQNFTTSLWIVSTPEGRRDSSVPTWTLRGCSC